MSARNFFGTLPSFLNFEGSVNSWSRVIYELYFTILRRSIELGAGQTNHNSLFFHIIPMIFWGYIKEPCLLYFLKCACTKSTGLLRLYFSKYAQCLLFCFISFTVNWYSSALPFLSTDLCKISNRVSYCSSMALKRWKIRTNGLLLAFCATTPRTQMHELKFHLNCHGSSIRYSANSFL